MTSFILLAMSGVHTLALLPAVELGGAMPVRHCYAQTHTSISKGQLYWSDTCARHI